MFFSVSPWLLISNLKRALNFSLSNNLFSNALISRVFDCEGVLLLSGVWGSEHYTWILSGKKFCSKDDSRTATFESWRSRFEAKRALPISLVSWSWWQRLMPRWHRLEVRFVKRRRKNMSQTSPRVSQRFLFPAVRALAKKQRQPSLSESAHFSEIMIWIVFE